MHSLLHTRKKKKRRGLGAILPFFFLGLSTMLLFHMQIVSLQKNSLDKHATHNNHFANSLVFSLNVNPSTDLHLHRTETAKSYPRKDVLTLNSKSFNLEDIRSS